MAKRGLLIVLEGVDRCGKTTQCRMLVDHLAEHGHQVTALHFPDYKLIVQSHADEDRSTAIGRTINAYLENKCDMDDRAVHLLFAANRWEARGKMRKLLEQGHHLVVDRYSHSGIVFTSAKGYDMDWCAACERGLPAPDLKLFLDLAIDRTECRGKFGEERYEVPEFQRKVRACFKTLMDRDGVDTIGERVGKPDTIVSNKWIIVDADNTIESVHRQIATLVDLAMEDEAALTAEIAEMS